MILNMCQVLDYNVLKKHIKTDTENKSIKYTDIENKKKIQQSSKRENMY